MKTSFYYLIRHISLLLVATIVATVSFAQGFSPAVQAKLQQVIDSFQNSSDPGIVGGMAAAINVDGLAFWKGATGYAARNIDAQNNLLPGGIPYTVNTLSRVYSVTKTFTAALTLELAREGYFSLDDPLIKYLPQITSVNPELNANVTIAQLLAHESGYSDYTTEINLQISIAFNPAHIWTPYETISFVHQVDTPGAVRKYSSTNYVLLGAIMEAATGKPVEQLYRKHFFGKLNLEHTYLGKRKIPGNQNNLAAPHDNISGFNPIFGGTGQPIFPDTVTNISRFAMDGVTSVAFTAGAMVSDVTDLTTWGNALFGGRATSKATLHTMVNSIAPFPDADGDYLGYGIFYNTQISATDTFIGHDGNALGYRALMFYQPDRKMTIAVTTNGPNPNPYAVAKALYAAMPDFLCGENKNRIRLCYEGYAECVSRSFAKFLTSKGAYLGDCEVPLLRSGDTSITKVLTIPKVETQGIRDRTGEHNQLFVSPNPVRKDVVFTFALVKSGTATLRLYDMNGKSLALLFYGRIDKGDIHQVHYDAGNLPAGMYIVSLQMRGETIQRKLVVIR